MQFSYSSHMQRIFPARISGVLALNGVHDRADVGQSIAAFLQTAEARLAERTEGEFPEIQA